MISAALRARWAGARLLPPRVLRESGRSGSHRSARRGQSQEFAEHRDYVAGDDLRHLDWSAYARHERLVTREFVAELERTVLLVVDRSASMEGVKAERSLQLAAALAWVGLGGGDRLALAVLAQDRIAYHPPIRSRAGWNRLIHWLGQTPAGGSASLARGWPEATARLPRAGLTLLISDALEPGVGRALAPLRFARQRGAVLQLLDAEDRQDPSTFEGPLALQDAEGGEERRLSVNAATCAAYRQALRLHCTELQAECARWGFPCLQQPAEAPPDQILQTLAGAGWLCF